MGQIMTLLDVIAQLDDLDAESTIYAMEPWTSSSSAIVAYEPTSGGLPESANELGLKYFLEVFLAKEILEDWAATLPAKPDDLKKCRRLIDYAVNDA